MERQVMIYRTNNLAEASLLRSLLEGNDIAVRVDNEHTVGVAPHLGISVGLDLYIDAADEARALRVIDAYAQAPTDDAAISAAPAPSL